MNTYTVAKTLLEEKLDAKLVKKHPYTGFDYIEGCTAIDNANKVFGHDGWSMEVLYSGIKQFMLAPTDKGTERGMISVPVRVTAKITLNELSPSEISTVIKEDIGTCVWNGKDQIETALKGAVTDGMKRALRMFGPQFGNDLYKKEEDAVIGQNKSFAGKEQAIIQEHNMNPQQASPVCDKCSSVMKLRNGKRGPFWGCSNYPNCTNLYNLSDIGLDGQRVGTPKAVQHASVPQQETPPIEAYANNGYAEGAINYGDDADSGTIGDVPF